MIPTQQRMCYVLVATRLAVLVNLAHSKTNVTQRHYAPPWLTICAEPVSQTVLASHLHPDPPSLSTIHSLLYEVLTPSEGHPSGRMPDELWGDSSVLSIACGQEGLFEQIGLSLGQIPFSSTGIPERLVSRLLADLQKDFPAAHCEKDVYHENSLPTFADIEQWCKQWVISSGQTAQDQQRQDFLTYCQTQWRTRGIDAWALDMLLEGPWPAHVTSSGVEHRDAIYWHPALASLCDQEVAIRTIVTYLPPSQVEVFVQDRWVCSAPFVSSSMSRMYEEDRKTLGTYPGEGEEHAI